MGCVFSMTVKHNNESQNKWLYWPGLPGATLRSITFFYLSESKLHTNLYTFCIWSQTAVHLLKVKLVVYGGKKQCNFFHVQ